MRRKSLVIERLAVALAGAMLAGACAHAAEADALAISANIQARHLPFGTIIDPVFASPGSDQIVAYTRFGESAGDAPDRFSQRPRLERSAAGWKHQHNISDPARPDPDIPANRPARQSDPLLDLVRREPPGPGCPGHDSNRIGSAE